MLDNIEVFTQSSIRIKNAYSTIYLDPFRLKEEPHDADYVFITHPHYDHFSIEDIKKVIKRETIMIVPEKMEDDAGELRPVVKDIVAVKPGIYKEINGLEIETVPAYNTIKPFHPKRAEWLGYILRIDNKRIYISGDTGATKDARQVKCDIALIPIGGTYTMDVKKAAELINLIRPEYAIPTHYGSSVGNKADGQTFASLIKKPIKVVEKIQYFE
ncbi:MBL fold metallo-hydrolase [Butyrivibrio sp. M55]|uniref:MBL fold metallo-hydrolase n=1 Tax=Butyrivibrio sp. M55 TaxID=1855323 RepID=UPI0008E07DA9|nr:MBL fold metallo-hydrolase [Butyrivibrio sp. M55]SFU87012.1 L-ascorbate metabolism protein UlaG, beta-lactamase superfamily [Butyrivibrio sp. M55]